MGAGGETRIDTALFAATADATKAAAREIARLCQDWIRSMNGLRGVWQGGTSDNVRNTAAQVQKSAAALTETLAGYDAALREIAGIYDQTEKSVQESGKSLKFEGSMR